MSQSTLEIQTAVDTKSSRDDVKTSKDYSSNSENSSSRSDPEIRAELIAKIKKGCLSVSPDYPKEFLELIEMLRENHDSLKGLRISAIHPINAIDIRTLIEALHLNTNVKSLEFNIPFPLQGREILIEGLRTNKSISSLKFIAYSKKEDNETMLDGLRTNTTLTSFDLINAMLNTRAAKAFIEMVKTNITLRRLNLKNSQVEIEDIKTLTEALRTNSTLTDLGLRGTLFNEQFIAVLEALKTNKILVKLDASYFHFGPAIVKAFTEELMSNKTLTYLNLSSNNLGKEAASAFSKVLKVNKSLTSLDLSANDFVAEDGKIFAEALTSNRNLTSLNLERNDLGVEGAKAFSEMLMTNTTLDSLSLNSNNLGEKGGKAFAEMLATNRTLTHLDLENNALVEDNIIAFSGMLTVNKTLIYLHIIEGNDLKFYQKISLIEVLKLNKSLTSVSLVYKNLDVQADELHALEEMMQRNKMITWLGDCFCSRKINQFIERNEAIANKVNRAWVQAGLPLICFKADPEGKINLSILPLIPYILKLADLSPLKDTCDNDRKNSKDITIKNRENLTNGIDNKSGFNISKFMGGLYFSNCLNSFRSEKARAHASVSASASASTSAFTKLGL